MNFLVCGSKDAPPVLMIHGLAASAERCYAEIARPLAKKYRVILACLDGHDPRNDTEFTSIELCCKKIEHYIGLRFGGSVYAISGFSLGGTVALELMRRGNIRAEKLHLDSAASKCIGLMKIPEKLALTNGAGFMQKGHKIPDIALDRSFLNFNRNTCDMLYKYVTAETINNACNEAYGYKISSQLKKCGSDVQFWCGSEERSAQKTARALEQKLPNIKVRVFKGLKHGELLHMRQKIYLRELKRFLNEK